MKFLGYLLGTALMADGVAAIFHPDRWARYTRTYTRAMGSCLPESERFNQVVDDYINLPPATVKFWAAWEIAFGAFLLRLTTKARE